MDLTKDTSKRFLFLQILFSKTLVMQETGFLSQLRDTEAQRDTHMEPTPIDMHCLLLPSKKTSISLSY